MVLCNVGFCCFIVGRGWGGGKVTLVGSYEVELVVIT